MEILTSLSNLREHSYVSGYDMAVVALSLGEKEAAGAYLMQALAEHEPWLIYLRQDSLMQPLQGTPQYAEAVRLLFSDTSG